MEIVTCRMKYIKFQVSKLNIICSCISLMYSACMYTTSFLLHIQPFILSILNLFSVYCMKPPSHLFILPESVAASLHYWWQQPEAS